MSCIKLGREDVLSLVDSYRNKECLWNKKCKNYKKLNLRNEAWQKLAEEFSTSTEKIKKKIKYLRAAYTAELKKVNDINGSEYFGVNYVPQLFYFSKLSFINCDDSYPNTTNNDSLENMSNLSSRSNLKSENDFDFESSDLELTYKSDGSCSSLKKSKRNKVDCPNSNQYDIASDYNKAILGILKSLKPSTDDDDVYTAFGKSVALQLKHLPEIEAASAMSDIQTLLSRKTTGFIKKAETTNSTESGAIFVPLRQKVCTDQ